MAKTLKKLININTFRKKDINIKLNIYKSKEIKKAK